MDPQFSNYSGNKIGLPFLNDQSGNSYDFGGGGTIEELKFLLVKMVELKLLVVFEKGAKYSSTGGMDLLD